MFEGNGLGPGPTISGMDGLFPSFLVSASGSSLDAAIELKNVLRAIIEASCISKARFMKYDAGVGARWAREGVATPILHPPRRSEGGIPGREAFEFVVAGVTGGIPGREAFEFVVAGVTGGRFRAA